MKVKIKSTGEILDVTKERANYWVRVGYATKYKEPEKEVHKDIIDFYVAEKVIKDEVTKKAVRKETSKKNVKK